MSITDYIARNDVYELEVEETEIDGFKVKVYDSEKFVCDAIKYRNKIRLDVNRPSR